MDGKALTLKHTGKLGPCELEVRAFTIGDFFREFDEFYFMKEVEGLANRSLYDYKRHFRYFKEYIQGEGIPKSAELTATIFRAYIHYQLSEKKVNKTTTNIRLRTLRAYLKWLYLEEKLEKDIAVKVKLMREPRKNKEILTNEEVKMFIKGIDVSTYPGFRDFTLCLLMLDCGVRISEGLSLTTKDINFRKRIITIRGEEAKTRRERVIPISNKTSKFLKELMEIANETDYDYVFQAKCGGILDSRLVQTNFQNYCKRANIKRRITPHLFRHTFASNFIRDGGDPFTLQRILGHTTMEMTKHYVHQNIDSLIKKHREANSLDTIFK
jgi:integrase/recombinase XerD